MGYRIVRFVAWAYLALGVLALFLIPVSIYGWFGATRDPLGAVFAVMLAMPWTALLGDLVGGDNALAGFALCAAGIAINAAILFWIARRLGRPNPARSA